MKDVVEGVVTIDDEEGVVVWEHLPDEDDDEGTASGIAAGGLVGMQFDGKRVRVTIEELEDG